MMFRQRSRTQRDSEHQALCEVGGELSGDATDRGTSDCAGRAIQQQREASGMTPQELADRAAVDPDHLAEIESGEADTADWNTVARLSRAAGSSLVGTATLAEHLEAGEVKCQSEKTHGGGKRDETH